jgi:hypothetical protein
MLGDSMFIKVKNNEIIKYPYAMEDLYVDYPNTSFPDKLESSTLAEFDIYIVNPSPQPQVDHTKNVVEETPNLFKGEWYQDWVIADATTEEIAQRQSDMVNSVKQQRAEAYRNESDPLFFKAQRNEATMEEWIAKVNDIKTRYPDPVFD